MFNFLSKLPETIKTNHHLLAISLFLAFSIAACKKAGVENYGGGPEGDPIINTTPPSAVTTTSAVTGGQVLLIPGDGEITERGVCYATWAEPTETDFKVEKGSGKGTFTVELTGLTAGKKYYIRAYALTADGAYYGNELTFSTPVGNIGDNFGGGIIFYLDASGQHGLACAKSDKSTGIEWGCNGTTTGALADGISTGDTNTSDIVDVCNSGSFAAKICANLNSGGYSDWFLPSLGQLNLMYKNLHANGEGNFEDAEYWSSTEKSASNAAYQDFSDGQLYAWFKDNQFRVRPVRAF